MSGQAGGPDAGGACFTGSTPAGAARQAGTPPAGKRPNWGRRALLAVPLGLLVLLLALRPEGLRRQPVPA